MTLKGYIFLFSEQLPKLSQTIAWPSMDMLPSSEIVLGGGLICDPWASSCWQDDIGDSARIPVYGFGGIDRW